MADRWWLSRARSRACVSLDCAVAARTLFMALSHAARPAPARALSLYGNVKDYSLALGE
jgi:hypothetical protein